MPAPAGERPARGGSLKKLLLLRLCGFSALSWFFSSSALAPISGAESGTADPGELFPQCLFANCCLF